MIRELEMHIKETCGNIKESNGLNIQYADGELSLDDEFLFAGTEKECGLVVAGMYIMSEIIKEHDHDTYKR